MSRRTAVLYDLVNGSRPVDQVSEELATFGWDSEEELVVLNRSQVAAILTDYLAGFRSATEVQAWAEAIEGRDDVGIATDSAVDLHDMIFRLANPELGHALTALFAQKLIRELQV